MLNSENVNVIFRVCYLGPVKLGSRWLDSTLTFTTSTLLPPLPTYHIPSRLCPHFVIAKMRKVTSILPPLFQQRFFEFNHFVKMIFWVTWIFFNLWRTGKFSSRFNNEISFAENWRFISVLMLDRDFVVEVNEFWEVFVDILIKMKKKNLIVYYKIVGNEFQSWISRSNLNRLWHNEASTWSLLGLSSLFLSLPYSTLIPFSHPQFSSFMMRDYRPLSPNMPSHYRYRAAITLSDRLRRYL